MEEGETDMTGEVKLKMASSKKRLKIFSFAVSNSNST